LFSVGSSAVEMALGNHWQAKGRLRPVAEWPVPGRAEPLLVASGSCSPVTAGASAWGTAQRFAEIALDAEMVAWNAHVDQALKYLSEGRSLILHTGHTPAEAAPAVLLGTELGRLLKTILEKTVGVRRLVIAGGDTSSYAARALGLEA